MSEISHRRIRIDHIQIDPLYQRTLNEKWVRKIASTFDWTLFTPPIVSERKDGSLWGIDCQHRIAGAIQAGHGKATTLCMVHTGLTPVEEAAMFSRYQTEIFRLNVHDWYKAGVASRDPECVEISKIMKKNGVQVSNSTKENNVKAIGALLQVYRLGTLPNVISVLKGWANAGGGAGVFDATLIKAMAVFLRYYTTIAEEQEDQGERVTAVDLGLLGKALTREDPALLKDRIKHLKNRKGFNTQYASVAPIHEVYNKGLRGHRKLPDPTL